MYPECIKNSYKLVIVKKVIYGIGETYTSIPTLLHSAFFYLAMPDLLLYTGSSVAAYGSHSSLTKKRTCAPCTGSRVLAIGPPRKSLCCLYWILQVLRFFTNFLFVLQTFWKFVTNLHSASLPTLFFQWCLLISGLCVTVW